MYAENNELNAEQKRVFAEIFARKEVLEPLLTAYAKQIKQKKQKSVRNKRYYVKHKDVILQKNKIKNDLYKKFIENY